MSDELALVDTNVLLYGHFSDSDHYAASHALLDQAQNGQLALCITPPILAEFYAIVTNPRRVTAPFTPEEALDAIAQVLAMPGLTMLPIPVDIVPQWIAQARQHPVRGADIFDVQLVSTMLASGVSRIYTFNTSHFAPFTELEVLTP